VKRGTRFGVLRRLRFWLPSSAVREKKTKPQSTPPTKFAKRNEKAGEEKKRRIKCSAKGEVFQSLKKGFARGNQTTPTVCSAKSKRAPLAENRRLAQEGFGKKGHNPKGCHSQTGGDCEQSRERIMGALVQEARKKGKPAL